MQFDRISRRFFLQGLGGATLAVPFLGSLVPRAEAASLDVGNLKNIIFLKQSHGASYENIQPPANLAWKPLGNGMRSAPMPTNFSGFGASYSKASLADLKDQISHISGLDCTTHQHDHWNNYFINGNPGGALYRSVDQVIAKHIYGSQTPVVPSITTGFADFSGEGPGYDDNGTIRKPANFHGAGDMFRSLFQSLTGASNESQNIRDRSAIDKVHGDLKSLLGSGRLSQADKSNLQNYVDLINDFEKRLATRKAITCVKPAAPTYNGDAYYAPEISMSEQSQYVAAAMACGMTRVAVMYLYDINLAVIASAMTQINALYPSIAGDHHHAVAHSISYGPTGGGESPVPGYMAREAASTIDAYMLNCTAFLARALKGYVDESTGLTLLDKTAVIYGREFGASKVGDDVHMLRDMHLMIIGGGQAINSGFVYDYKTTTAAPNYAGRPLLGLPYNDFLVGMMLAMGLKPADWELNGQPGFGVYEATLPYLLRDRRSPPPGLLRAY